MSRQADGQTDRRIDLDILQGLQTDRPTNRKITNTPPIDSTGQQVYGVKTAIAQTRCSRWEINQNTEKSKVAKSGISWSPLHFPPISSLETRGNYNRQDKTPLEYMK